MLLVLVLGLVMVLVLGCVVCWVVVLWCRGWCLVVVWVGCVLRRAGCGSCWEWVWVWNGVMLVGGGVGVVDVGLSLVGRSVFEDRAVVLGDGGGGCWMVWVCWLVVVLVVVWCGVCCCGGGAVFLFPGQGSQWEGMAVGFCMGLLCLGFVGCGVRGV